MTTKIEQIVTKWERTGLLHKLDQKEKEDMAYN